MRRENTGSAERSSRRDKLAMIEHSYKGGTEVHAITKVVQKPGRSETVGGEEIPEIGEGDAGGRCHLVAAGVWERELHERVRRGLRTGQIPGCDVVRADRVGVVTHSPERRTCGRIVAQHAKLSPRWQF